MKKTLQILLLCVFSIFYSQTISDYPYIIVADQFSGFKPNQYQLHEIFSNTLKGRKYIVLNEDMQNWPVEIKINPCNALKAELKDNSTMLRNRIIVEFKDCNNKIITQFVGKSNIKELEEGFKDALNNALIALPISKQKTSPNPLTNDGLNNKGEIYTNGNFNLHKIIISEGQFILTVPNNSAPFATFKSSSKKEVYHVQLQDASQTLGYIENGNIIIELPNSDGNFSIETFSKK